MVSCGAQLTLPFNDKAVTTNAEVPSLSEIEDGDLLHIWLQQSKFMLPVHKMPNFYHSCLVLFH